jgi:hypothetical protein
MDEENWLVGWKGIGAAVEYEADKEMDEKNFKEKFLAAQRPPRGRF